MLRLVYGILATPTPPDDAGPVNGWAMQAGYQIANLDQFDSDPEKTWNAEKDLLVIPGRALNHTQTIQAHITRIQGLKAINPRLRVMMYTNPGQVRKTYATQAASSGHFWRGTLINSGTRGDDDWYAKDVNGNKVEHKFNSNDNKANEADHLIPTNSFGRTYAEQSWEDCHTAYSILHSGNALINQIDGFFQDVVPPLPDAVFELDSSPRNEVAIDYEQDGTPDSRTDNSPTGGATKWRTGQVQWITKFRAKFGTSLAYMQNNTRDGTDYTSGSNDKFPISDSEFYRVTDLGLFESVNHGINRNNSTDTYDVDNDFFSLVCRKTALIRTRLIVDNGVFGDMTKHMIVADYELVDRTLIAIDYEMYRFMGAFAALNGVMNGCVIKSGTPVPRLDEYQFEWGSPISGTHPDDAMGVLDLGDSTYVLRTPDFTNGGATFFWVEFDNVIWVLRSDYPSTGAGNYGTGSNVNCELPDPGSGKKWIHPDFTSTYTNPNASWLQTRNQTPGLNDGSDAALGGSFGSVALRPAHAAMMQRVDT